MKQSAVEWLINKLNLFNITKEEHYEILCQIELEAKEMEKQQQDEFAIKFTEWKDINCIYYDGWNIKVPLGDKYSDVYTNEELLEIYKKEQF